MPTRLDSANDPGSAAGKLPPSARVTGVSVVIPTRDRPVSLRRTLAALAAQTHLPDEVVIVDAGAQPPDPSDADARERAHPGLRIVLVPAEPRLPAQRNTGVARARGSHVLFLDDDIEPPPVYLEGLLAFLAERPDVGAVTGIVEDRDGSGAPHDGLDPPRLRHLLAAFVFQHSVWSDVEGARAGPLGAAPLALLRRWYRRRDNTWSLAGWPLVTQVGGTSFRTATYGLGAALVRRDWLLASPYDERLGPQGIGDHYGVALGFPGERPIVVLPALRVVHHREGVHRLSEAEAHVERVLALDRFLRTSGRFRRTSRLWLAWSLVGKAALAAARGRGRLAGASLRALGLVALGRNPRLRDAEGRAPAGRTDGPAPAARP